MILWQRLPQCWNFYGLSHARHAPLPGEMVGLFGAMEIGFENGPLLMNHDYHLTSKVLCGVRVRKQNTFGTKPRLLTNRVPGRNATDAVALYEGVVAGIPAYAGASEAINTAG